MNEEMKNKFCNGCEFLNITEQEQNELKIKIDHICQKYKVKVYHENFHPLILKCEECAKFIYSQTVFLNEEVL